MQISEATPQVALPRTPSPRQTLIGACLAHATHDGLTDLVYVFLPVWQQRFQLSFTVLSLLRSAYSLTLAVLQVPAAALAVKMARPQYLLVVATLLSGAGWLLGGLVDSVLLLGLTLVLSGIGASTQHPIASAMVSRAYGRQAKKPLGVYNFAGDLGKSLMPAGAAVLLGYMSYKSTMMLTAVISVLAAGAIWALLGAASRAAPQPRPAAAKAASGTRANPAAFYALLGTGVLDSAVRMGFLTFLPFIVKAHGGSLEQTGLALTLVFIGGAVGKFVCGWLSESLGMIRTVFVTELGTAVLIGAVLWAPLGAGLLVLPLLGAVLNGTSSVLYGAVADVVESTRLERAFAVFYTGTIGSGALAPVLYGLIGDHQGVTFVTVVVALTAVATLLPVMVFAVKAPASTR